MLIDMLNTHITFLDLVEECPDIVNAKTFCDAASHDDSGVGRVTAPFLATILLVLAMRNF